MSVRTSGTPQGAALSKPPPLVRTSGAKRRFVNRRSLGLLLVSALFVIGVIDWFSATTSRLYVDEDSAASQQQGTVWQHFGRRGNEVVPEIISADEARFTFPIILPARQRLQFTAHPEGPAEYDIFLRTDSGERKIASAKIERPQIGGLSLPSGKAELKFAVHGRIAWFDLRLTRQFQWPVYLFLFVVFLFVACSGGGVPHRAANWLTLCASCLLCLVLIESVLRAVAPKLPLPILTARHELGLIAPDPRWVDSPRYQQRLRSNLRTYCEWSHGDIVRMGFLPPGLFGAEHHRYPFETDAEGFRNPAVRIKIDIAALGDSFVEAMTSPREEAWPARLEQLTGHAVQNYGTSSYGPQQESYVLEDYAIGHQPRDVVLGYFAGNDPFDAERFDDWERGGEKPGQEASGWRLQKRFRRFETLFLTTIARRVLPATRSPEPSPVAASPDKKFDRGAYQIPVGTGATLRFAFMPPYLQKLAGSREEFERSRGWALTRAALNRMRDTCVQNGSRLTVMFIPSKAAVYWPLVEHSLGQEELQRSLDFVSSYNHMPLNAADIRAHRLVQNELMREFCLAEKIPFLDLTPTLEEAAASGRAVYFADDAHWNAAGHELAARELARFLTSQP
jgi:acetyltransferase AlgX (SGNH hydrolase-like protein)